MGIAIWIEIYGILQSYQQRNTMIRTKAELLLALKGGKKLIGHQRNKPSAPWEYTIDNVVVHGGAVLAAARAKEIVCVYNHWTHSFYRLAK